MSADLMAVTSPLVTSCLTKPDAPKTVKRNVCVQSLARRGFCVVRQID